MTRHVGAALLLTLLLCHPAGAWVTGCAPPAVIHPAPIVAAPYHHDSVLSIPAAPSYAYPLDCLAPSTIGPAPPLAVPTPAPPSAVPATPVPATPLPKVQMPPAGDAKTPAPVVTEARSMSGTPSTLAKDRCRVGFWNLTGKDVTLVVDGKARTLPRDRALTLELARAFVWQVDQQPAREEHVAENKSGHEVVIR